MGLVSAIEVRGGPEDSGSSCGAEHRHLTDDPPSVRLLRLIVVRDHVGLAVGFIRDDDELVVDEC